MTEIYYCHLVSQETFHQNVEDTPNAHGVAVRNTCFVVFGDDAFIVAQVRKTRRTDRANRADRANHADRANRTPQTEYCAM